MWNGTVMGKLCNVIALITVQIIYSLCCDAGNVSFVFLLIDTGNAYTVCVISFTTAESFLSIFVCIPLMLVFWVYVWSVHSFETTL